MKTSRDGGRLWPDGSFDLHQIESRWLEVRIWPEIGVARGKWRFDEDRWVARSVSHKGDWPLPDAGGSD